VSRAEVEVPDSPSPPPGIIVFRCLQTVNGLQCARPRRHGDDCCVVPDRNEVLQVLSRDTVLVPRKVFL
jgi:hypothetical protein